MNPKKLLLLDFETRATVSILNPHYTSHINTKIICMSHGFRGNKPELWWNGDKIPQYFIDHVKSGGMLGASNARFDREIYEYVGVNDHGFPETALTQWYCTQAEARYSGLPSALDKSARALRIKQRKSSTGKALITKCCIPPFSEDPQDYKELGLYCLQDHVVMNDVSLSIPDLTPAAILDYQCNERVNDRGIKIDRELALAAQEYAEPELREINKKLESITCGDITKSTQHKRICKWLRECLEDDGLKKVVKLMTRYKTDKETKVTKKGYSSDKSVRANLMAGHKSEEFTLSADILELLQLMEDAGGTAVSKFRRMTQKASLDDDRVRGILRYAGAPSTIRFSSMDLQVHNFRRDAFTPDFVDFLKAQMMRKLVLKDREGNVLPVMDTLGRLLRGAIIPGDGNVLVVNDWSAVESRMTAWLSGETDKLAMFDRGDCPYCYAAEGVYGRKITKENDPIERDVGKVCDLSLGFLGGVGALASMATNKKVYIDPEKMQDIVDAYRLKHAKTVAYGNALLAAAHRAVTNPNTKQPVGTVSYYFDDNDGALYCTLSDGITKLRYPECRFELKAVPWDETQFRPQLTALKASFTPKADAKEWARHGLWRGIFLENVAQGNCAILLRHCIIECEKQGLPVIFHVHDEIIVEAPEKLAEEAKSRLQKIMETPPKWIEDLQLVAIPETMLRYGK